MATVNASYFIWRTVAREKIDSSVLFEIRGAVFLIAVSPSLTPRSRPDAIDIAPVSVTAKRTSLAEIADAGVIDPGFHCFVPETPVTLIDEFLRIRNWKIRRLTIRLVVLGLAYGGTGIGIDGDIVRAWSVRIAVCGTMICPAARSPACGREQRYRHPTDELSEVELCIIFQVGLQWLLVEKRSDRSEPEAEIPEMNEVFEIVPGRAAT